MSAFELPASDAPAEEWGALAVSIPDWRNPRLPWMPYLLSPTGTSHVPDPDHWAWEGWLRWMLGPCQIGHYPTTRMWSAEIADVFRMSTTAGRACIAVAAANGRWPGGGA